LRDHGDDFCSDCTPQGKATVHLEHKFKTEVNKIGMLRGFAIYDVFYRFDDHVDAKTADWKSIHVEASPGQFHEIYHLQPTAGELNPSYLLKVGSEKIVATSTLIPGTGSYYYEDYFWFSSAGAERIDIEKITGAAQSVLPNGNGVWQGGGLDMTAQRYFMPVWKEGDANCCPSGGTVEIRFRLQDGRVVVTSKHYDPKGEFGE
jgi:hypothetical protein